MTRLYGVDLSHFQDPAHPAGVGWDRISEKSSFAIVRATYGTSPDARAAAHIGAARLEAMQVGLYHFLVASQSIPAQIDVFCAQAVKCGVGAGDILPALDVEDDGPRQITPAMEPLVRAACDILIERFGGVMIYITQRDFGRLGKPAWILEHPLWCAHYTNAAKPATPGNVAPAIWQNRVGLYNPGAPFVLAEANSPNAIDQNVADAPLPLATKSPAMPGSLPLMTTAAPLPLWQQRLDALTDAAFNGLHETDPEPKATS